MSMHQMEAYIEEAVRAVALSDLPVQHKRDLIYSLFDMETYGDCGFTNLRTINEMLACKYTFVFAPEEMHDYGERRDFYDRGDTGIVKENDVYIVENDEPDSPKRIYVDSGTPAWDAMVKSGAITGEGALPVRLIDSLTVLKEVNPLLGDILDDEYIREGMMATAFLTGAVDDMNDEEVQEIMGMSREELEDMAD